MAAAGASSGAARALVASRELELLVEQWTPFAYSIARDYFLPGADLADLRQEALIGLVKGLRDFEASIGVPLKSFLALTIRRQVITAVKTATRMKHRPLSEALRQVVLEDETVDAIEAVADPRADTHRDLVGRLELRRVLDRLPELTELERRAVVGFTVGGTYLEIAGGDPSRVKQVDNAFQRARRKLLSREDDLKEAA